jgi:hypothetical protein
MSIRPQRVNAELPEGVEQYFDQRNIEVLECFGMNAPDLLNDYSCAVEDALIKVMGDFKELKQRHNQLQARFSILIDALKETSAAADIEALSREAEEDNAAD